MRTIPPPPDRFFVRVASILALALVYAVIGRVGLLAEPVAGFATLVWPPSGIALAALTLRGRWLWPGVVLGAAAVNLWVGAPLPVAVGISVGNTVAAVLASEGLRRASFDPTVSRVRDVVALGVIGAGLSTLASASIGVASLRAGGLLEAPELAGAFRAWWLGDAMGNLVLAPLALVWASRAPLEAPPARAVEAMALTALTIAAGLAVFGGVLDRAQEGRSMYLLFPSCVWAAVRFGQRGATAAVSTISAIAVLGTISGHGPFTRGGLPALLELQSFMAVVAAMLLVLGAAISERDHARTQAVEAVHARDDFLAIASHELRTPLATLVLLFGTMKRRVGQGPEAEELERALTSAERQTDRLTQLVRHLTDASRIDRGVLSIDRKPADLAEIVREVARENEEAAALAGCELRLAIEGPIHGEWDRLRIEQVVKSLLANALRHAPGAPVDVSLTSAETGATLEVSDRGPGIAPDRLEQIFQRYQRGGAKRERGGLGLGLHIARHLVEAHGGTLRAEPRAGGGARFVVLMARPQPRALAGSRTPDSLAPDDRT